MTMAPSERESGIELARALGVRHEVVESHELERPGFAANPTDRCYHCKAELLEIAAARAPTGWACARSCWGRTSTTWAITARAWTPPTSAAPATRWWTRA